MPEPVAEQRGVYCLDAAQVPYRGRSVVLTFRLEKKTTTYATR